MWIMGRKGLMIGRLAFTVVVIVTMAHLLGSPWWETKTTCRVNCPQIIRKLIRYNPPPPFPPPQKKKIRNKNLIILGAFQFNNYCCICEKLYIKYLKGGYRSNLIFTPKIPAKNNGCAYFRM